MTEVGGLCSRAAPEPFAIDCRQLLRFSDALTVPRLQNTHAACQSGRGIADDACEREAQDFRLKLIFVNRSLRWALDNKGSAL